MGRRLEMPPACRICSRAATYEDYCGRCVKGKVFYEAIDNAWSADQARIDGKLYRILPEPIQDPRHPSWSTGGRGFGGAKFKIRFHDGRVVVTRNLWSYGEIPEGFREALPDNAVFVKTRPERRREKGGRRPGVSSR